MKFSMGEEVGDRVETPMIFLKKNSLLDHVHFIMFSSVL